MHRRMLVIRGFEERVAALYRDGEVPGFVHLSIGQEASAVGACWPLGPADVITSTHRGHGHCLAKGLDPLGMFAELMAQGRGHEPRARRLDAHRRSRRSASSAPTGSSAPGCRSRWAPRRRRSCGTTAASRSRSSATARSRTARSTRRSTSPRCGSCRWSSSARTTATPSSRRRRRNTRRRSSSAAAGYGVDYVAVDGNDVVRDRDGDARRGRRGSRRARSRRRRGHDLPLARPLRRRPAALPIDRRSPRVGGARPARSSTRGRLRAAGVTDDALDALRVVRSTRELDDAVDAARRARRARDVATLTDFVVRAATRAARAAAPGRRRPGVPHHGRDPRRARGRARRRRARVRRRHRRRGGRQRVRPDARAARPLRRSRPRHADLRDRDRRPRRRRRDGGHAPRRRADVPRLPRRVPRPAAQPGREAAVHDRRRRARWR